MARRGNGSGPKRRQRTTFLKDPGPYGNSYQIKRKKTTKALPANWRELLVERVRDNCIAAPERIIRNPLAGQSFPPPTMTIPPDSTPDVVIFGINKSDAYGERQYRTVDFTLTMCDVVEWPVPKVTRRTLAGGAVGIATDLPLRDAFHTLVGPDRRHWLDLSGFRLVPGMNPDHIVQYETGRGRARNLGIRTTCGTADDCRCRELLPLVWQFGWKMYY